MIGQATAAVIDLRIGRAAGTVIRSAAGSMILMWGKPGSPVVELRQLKMAAGEFGPLRVVIDHRLGTVEIDKDGKSVWVAERCGANTCARH